MNLFNSKEKKKKTSFLLWLFILGLFPLLQISCKDSEQNAYQFYAVKKGSILNSVTATGTVEPITQVEVGTQVSGIIRKIYVDYNSVVKEGQILAELDKIVLEMELNSSRAEVNSTKSEFEYQEKNYARIKGLSEKKLVSDSDYESALYSYQKAQNTYDKARANLVKAQTNLGYATIYSPINGVVLSRAIDEGQTVAASLNTPTLFTIANKLESMQVVANVDEADIGDVSEKQEVDFTVDAFPDDIFKGTITQVRLQPTTTNNVVTYEVVINAPNPELKLKPGLTANVSIYTQKQENVLCIPLKSLRFQPSTTHNTPLIQTDSGLQKEQIVWVESKQQPLRKQSIRIGISDGIYCQVLEGLKEGEQIAVGYLQASETKSSEASQGATSQENKSPFMPQRPGQGRKNN